MMGDGGLIGKLAGRQCMTGGGVGRRGAENNLPPSPVCSLLHTQICDSLSSLISIVNDRNKNSEYKQLRERTRE